MSNNADAADPLLLRASYVIQTLDAETLRDGAVLVSGGRVRDVGPAATLARRSGVCLTDLDDAFDRHVVLTPGLVNAHTHLELSGCRHDTFPTHTPTDFVPWALSLARRAGFDTPETDELAVRVAAACEAGVRASLAAGVTCVGDVSRFPRLTRATLAMSPMRVVSFGEVTAIGRTAGRLAERLGVACSSEFATNRLTVGVSPHATYSVSPDGYRRCVDAARSAAVPLTTHVAELPYEGDFLRDRSGPLRDLLDAFGVWDETGHDALSHSKNTPSAVAFADAVGVLAYERSLLAHVNYCDDHDLRLLARGRAAVVWCPRTHAAFGHRPHRWRDLLDGGVLVAIGTDSLASSPSLDVLDELRFVRASNPDLPGDILWRSVTTHPADALGLAGQGVGRIVAHGVADFVAWPYQGGETVAEILDPLLDSRPRPLGVWVDGHERASTSGFSTTMSGRLR